MVDWIQIDKNSGNSGTTVITVTAATYSELVQRTTSLTVNTVNTSLSGSVAITQEARDVVTVMVSPTTISAPVCGGTYSFNIISNGDWTITYPEWVSLSQSAGTGNATITVVLGNNQTVEDLLGNIVVSTIDNSATVQVSQEGLYAYITVSPSAIEYALNGGERTIRISSNAPWTASTNVGWLTLSQSAGTGDTTITVTCSATSEDRNAVITFSTKDESVNTIVQQFNIVPYLYFNESELSFDGDGGSKSLGVNSNVSWEIVVSDYNPNLVLFALEDGVLSIINEDSGGRLSGRTVFYYSINGEEISSARTVNVVKDDIIIIYEVNNIYYPSYLRLSTTFKYNIKGNPFNLGDSFYYQNMFTGGKVVDASGLDLTAPSSAANFFSGMFKGCTNLITPPLILPETNLINGCYYQMFYGCTNLTTAPVLPATTLSFMCYEDMFRDCTNLRYIKCLATDISERFCVSNWVYNVQTNSGTFVKAAGMNDWSRGKDGIPNNWTITDNN